MSLLTACAEYGIDPADPIYNAEDHFDRGGERCRICLNHPKHHRRATCDLEAARAAEMDDPRMCFTCRRAYDFRSCEPVAETGWFGTCGECQAKEARLVEQLRKRHREDRLSPARAQYVVLQDPYRSLDDYSDTDLYRTAYDEVPS